MNPTMKERPAAESLSVPSYSPGLEGVMAGESAICLVDEGEAGLRYRGYAVADLAEQSSFEEVAYLLLYGHLPNRQELDGFCGLVDCGRILPGSVQRCLAPIPSGAHPMDVLRSGMSLLGLADAEAQDGSHDANLRKSVRLLGQIPLLIAHMHDAAAGSRPCGPESKRSFAHHLLQLLTDREEDEFIEPMARVLNVSLILYAEHEFNASTFAARVVASTLTDLHGAVTAAVASLKGPLHGGANEAVASMMVAIGRPEKAEAWVRETLAKRQRIMGFGHRVLKQGDARSAIIQRHAEELSHLCGEHRWIGIAHTIDRIVQEEKGLYPNLDFYTAVAYLLMGIPPSLYTPLFVCSRIAGWCAHVIEQQDHNRLMRPRARYTGPAPRSYEPLDRR
ncbi:MAG: citrate synthase [Nitrospira sp.]